MRCEGELVLPELCRRVIAGEGWQDLPGLVWRTEHGVQESSGPTPLYSGVSPSGDLDFDNYFERIARCALGSRVFPWLPFEGSRGCWYGEKTQCRFCGLHEIMKFRSWGWEDVLKELERLSERYDVNRFFAVDLIMPKEYYTTLLPALVDRRHDWVVFYEIKANVREEEVAGALLGGCALDSARNRKPRRSCATANAEGSHCITERSAPAAVRGV